VVEPVERFDPEGLRDLKGSGCRGDCKSAANCRGERVSGEDFAPARPRNRTERRSRESNGFAEVSDVETKVQVSGNFILRPSRKMRDSRDFGNSSFGSAGRCKVRREVGVLSLVAKVSQHSMKVGYTSAASVEDAMSGRSWECGAGAAGDETFNGSRIYVGGLGRRRNVR